MEVKIADSWKEILQSEFDKEYFAKLTQFVKTEYASGRCYPPGNEIFNAFVMPFNAKESGLLNRNCEER